ncbi:MAG TPA: DNA repair protein RecO [Bacteroidia bacterium]|nr:DNA repair protein RecO [Bacteroidia bacterium]
MLQSTRGIVLHTIPYSDSRIIARIYTERSGFTSYMLSVSRSKKGKIRGNILQPLTQIEIVADHREKNAMQTAREISCPEPYLHLQDDIVKTSIALFLAEVLYKSVKEEEPNPPLFSFLTNAFHILDLHEEGVANFHLVFLVQLTRYLGFYPQQRSFEGKTFFDLKDGVFRSAIPPHPLYLEEAESRLLEELMQLSFDNMQTLALTGEWRGKMVKHLLQYYQLHLSSMHDVKSHHVLEAVLS